MFGLTKHQFLKKSKKALQETSIQSLSFRRLINQDAKDEIVILEAHRSLDRLRNHADDTFTSYRKLNPPSKCLQLQQSIINALILFYDSLVAYSESLHGKEDGLEDKSSQLMEKSSEKLNKYIEISLSLSREVDSNLQKK